MLPTPQTLNVLSAMITPAVLMSACGTMILSTTTRLARCVDRVRSLSAGFEEMNQPDARRDLLPQRRKMTFQLLRLVTRRARLLQRALMSLYMALSVFVLTSVSIGLETLIGMAAFSWVPIITGMLGASCLFYGSMLLIIESRLALAGTFRETGFLWELGKLHAPRELREELHESESKLVRAIMPVPAAGMDTEPGGGEPTVRSDK